MTRFLTGCCALLLAFAWGLPNSHALKIIPHFTAGPCPTPNPICDNTLSPGTVSLALTGPKKLIAGTTGTDCSAMTAEELVTTKTGAFCAGAMEWEKYILDEIEVHLEVYSIDATVPFLAQATPNSVYFVGDNAYNVMLNLQKRKNAQDENTFDLVSHVPNRNQYMANFSDLFGFILGEPILPDSLAVNTATFKALGVNPNKEGITVFPLTAFTGAGTLPGMDGVIRITEEPSGGSKWDLDPTDGIGINNADNSAISEETFNSINLLTGENAPPCYFGDGTPLPPDGSACESVGAIDYRAVATHEIGHIFDLVISYGDLLPLVIQTVGLKVLKFADLFRLNELDLGLIESKNDFRDIPRELDILAKLDPNEPLNDTNVENSVQRLVVDYNEEDGVLAFPVTQGQAPFLGLSSDGNTGHFRSNFNRVRNANGAVTGVDIIVPFPEGMRLMAPIILRNFQTNITQDDLQVLDLIGWDIDYNGLANTGAPDKAKANGETPIEALEAEFGVEAEVLQVPITE